MCLDVIEIIAMISQYKTQTKATGHKTLSTHPGLHFCKSNVSPAAHGSEHPIWANVNIMEVDTLTNHNGQEFKQTCIAKNL